MTDSVESGFKEVDTLLKVALPPSSSNRPLDAIKKELNQTLFKYSTHLDGVPVSYTNTRFPEGKEYARIFNENPWLHIDLLATVVVFRPEIGQVMRGKVSKVSDMSVAMLCHGMFNATVSAEAMAKRFRYSYDKESWESDDMAVAEGDFMLFKVTNLYSARGIFAIEGVLLDDQ